MKKLGVFCALLLCGAFAMAGCGGSKLVVYTNAEFPPFEYLSGGEIVGVDMDIMKKVAEELKMDIEFKNIDFDSALLGVQSGKADAVAAGVTKDPTRDAKMDASIPYFESVQSVISKKDDATDYAKIDGLKNKRIGVQRGTTGDKMISKLIADGRLDNATVTQYTDVTTATQEMLRGSQGKIDVVVIDKLPALITTRKNADTTKYTMLTDESVEVEQYVIYVQKGDKTLLDAVNKVLARMLENGEIEDLITQHEAVSGGVL